MPIIPLNLRTANPLIMLPRSVTFEGDPVLMEKTLLTMEEMEKRYAFENELIRAVSLGLTHKAEAMYSNFSQLAFKQRVSDPLRSLKNHCIIMNTVMRKAAEQGSVHPLYLDRVSADFSQKIELAPSSSAVYKLVKGMPSTYCRLVKRTAWSAVPSP